MSDEQIRRTDLRTSDDIDRSKAEHGQKSWEQPKVTKYVKPKLTRHGRLERVTGGFFGPFSP